MEMLIYITTVNSELFMETKKNCLPYLSGEKAKMGPSKLWPFDSFEWVY